ncbi:endo-1,4-beta-xylanase [Fibrobacter sp. UWOV1]|uniref:endo-1,4-beta-xylanase n=1 Tax=Fibrobacter sp. UWOV1 TaxID=1896215 RepID=UPI00091AE712|nr:endo-1,4-beta-xylanase [Fibrobacter sp. UWOV1]SHL57616.1 endo-1,4-beta-xylanase [Fibrobacter sp. UWOV1]
MKHTLSFSRIVFSAALIGAGFSNAVADETIRDLAKERHRFIGTILNSEWFNDAIEPEFEEIHKTQFNVVVAENEMKFDATEPRENEFNFTKGDKMVEYAQANGLRVRGHALAWHSQVPGWVNNYSGKKEKLLSVLKNHIDSVVGHWKGKVAEWDVVNEAINDDYNHDWRSTGSVWYEGIGPEFLDSAFVWAHAADPDAELCYNDYAVEWGINDGSKAGFVLEQVKRWKANGIPITCVGTQTHIEIAHETTPQNVRAFAKALAELDVTLNITELDIGFPKGSAGKLTAADYEKQGHLYRQFMDVFLEEPNMGEFVIWGLTDAHSWLDEQQGKTEGLLYDKQYKPKPAYDSIMVSLKAHPASEVKSPYPDSLFDAPCDGNCGDSSEAIKSIAGTSTLSMYLSGRTLSIAGATAAKVNVFDVQGRPVFSAKNVKKAVELSGLSEGLFVVRVRDGSKSLMQRIVVK